MQDFPKIQLDRNDFQPLYQQVYQALNGLIVENQLKPGDKLPSEKELETMFQVSKITVRRAIQELVYENKIKRIAGKGSFVLDHQIEPLMALTSFSENMIAQGYEPSYRDSDISLIDPPGKIAGMLGIDRDQKILHLSRMMLANGVPMAIQDSYLPASIYHQNTEVFIPELMDKISLYKIRG